MAKGNRIVVNNDARGRNKEFIIATGETWYPGMIVQIDPTVALVGGAHTAKIYDRDADGDHPLGPFWVVKEDFLQGKTINDAYDDGDGTVRAFCYCPLPGDELNLLYKDISGTGDDHVLGEIGIVDDGTGKIIVTTGSPETEVCTLLEAITDPTADTLAWVMWSGH